MNFRHVCLGSVIVALAGTALFAGCSGDPALGDDPGDAQTSSSSSGSSGPGNGGSSGAGGSSSGGGGSSSGGPVVPGAACNGSTKTAAPDITETPQVPTSLTVPAGFTLEALTSLSGPRHVVALPNGDLLIGSNGSTVTLVPHADAAKAGEPTTFVTIDDAPVHGVAFDAPNCMIYVASQHGIYRMPYADGQTTAEPGAPIAQVRASSGGGHTTTSVAVAGAFVFAGVGSSCNDCVESDPTRATVQRMNLDGTGMTTYARRIRNPIAVSQNPATGGVWAGVAGQDNLPVGHPYEFFDAVTAHAVGADYGWPDCEENQVNYSGDDSVSCASTVVPLVEMPAFSTLIAAAFYPTAPTGAHAFPAEYRGGAFLAAHGSWHEVDGNYFTPPRIAFVKMNGDAPVTAVDWSDPSKQWTEFVGGMQLPDGNTRVARAAGVAVGADGSLYVTDDHTAGLVLRVRPTAL